MNFPQLRPASPNRFLTCLAGFLVLLAIGFAVTARPAEAAVSGLQEAWQVEVGTDPGQFFNPDSLGVDPVDGSVFVLDEEPGGTGFRVDKFTADGEFKGSTAPLPATATEPGATEGRAFIGIAVDHSLGRFYLVAGEPGLDSTKPGLAVATKILSFSTEPQSEVLAAEPSLPLPPANEPAGTLLAPNEVQVDPVDGDLVISAQSEAGHVVLQRVTPAGALAGRYEESGGSLFHRGPRTLNFGFALGADDTTYIVANTGELEEGEAATAAFTLPAGFTSTSTLTALPGFQDAASAGGWETNPFALWRNEPTPRGDDPGPQVALSVAPNGEETLYWKSAHAQTTHESVRIHGWSLQQQATTVGFGGGALGGPCSIETREAALASTKNGNLVVLAQGQSLTGTSQSPLWEPQVLRFGPGSEFGARSSVCPDPAPAIALKAGGSAVTGSVAPGTTVTLDASGSELGGFTPSELVWTVTKAGGSPEHFPITGTPPSLELAHQFASEGEYTIQLQLKVSAEVPYIGNSFDAKPRKLMVTAGQVTHSLTITKTGTGTGTVTCKIDAGTAAACPTTVDDGAEVEVIASPGSGSELGTISGTGSATGCTTSPCHFTTGADSTVSVEFKLTGTPPTTHSLAVTKTGAGNGTVQCKINGGAAATCPTTVNDGNQVEVIAAPDSSSELGSVSGTGSATGCTTAPCSFAATADSTVTVELKAKASAGKHKLTIAKAGTGAGTVLCNGGNCATEYAAGTEVTLVAVASTGSTFGGWSGAGCSGTGPCKVVIGSSDLSVTATFTAASSGGGGGNNPPPSSGTPTPSPTPTPKPTPPSNTAKPGAVKQSGTTASLTIAVPGAGTLAASGKGLVSAKANAKGAGPVQLKLKLTTAEKKTLAKKGKVTIKVQITFTPNGGTAGTTTKTITFKVKKGH